MYFSGRLVKNRHFFSLPILATTRNKKMPKNAELFYCQHCDFTANKTSNFNKHILTRKHQKNVNGNTFATLSQQKKMPICDCGKSFQTRSGLWRHQQKCQKIVLILLICGLIHSAWWALRKPVIILDSLRHSFARN